MFNSLRKTRFCCASPSPSGGDDGEAPISRISTLKRSLRSISRLPQKEKARGPFPVDVQHLDEMVETAKVIPAAAQAQQAEVLSASVPCTPSGNANSSSSSNNNKPSTAAAAAAAAAAAEKKPGSPAECHKKTSSITSSIRSRFTYSRNSVSGGSEKLPKMRSTKDLRMHSSKSSLAKRGHRRNDSSASNGSGLGEEIRISYMRAIWLLEEEEAAEVEAAEHH